MLQRKWRNPLNPLPQSADSSQQCYSANGAIRSIRSRNPLTAPLPAHARDPRARVANLGHGRQMLGPLPDAVDEGHALRIGHRVHKRLALFVLRELEIHAGDAVEDLLEQRTVALALLNTRLD